MPLRPIQPLLARLDAAGVRAIILKGRPFSALVGGSLEARASRDVDLLVDRRDLRRASSTLESLGFKALPRSNPLIREVHLLRPGWPCIDLHWNPAGAWAAFPLDFEDLWAGRQTVEVDGASLPLPSNPWLVVLTSLFVVRELPVVERRYLRDLASLVRRFPDLDWARARSIARTTRALRLTTLALHLVERVETVPLPAAAGAAFPLDDACARRLRDVERLLARPDAEERAEFVSKAAAFLGHGRYREAWRDRVRPWLLFPLFLLLPDEKDIERAAASGRMAWRERLARVPEVVAAVRRHRSLLRMTRRFRHALGGGSATVKPRAEVSLHLAGDEGLLLNGASGELFGLTTTAAWIWCQLEDGCELQDLPGAFANTFAVRPEAASGMVLTALRDWWRLGLLEGAPRPPAAAIGAPEEAPLFRDGMVEPTITARYRLLDRIFEVGLPDAEAERRVTPLLDHLQACDRSVPADRLDVVRTQAGFVILRDRRIVERADRLEALGPQVKSALLVAAINAKGFALYLHAAMLRRGAATILLPAAPGSGKTCLAAALARAGFAYHTDEVTLLEGGDFLARGVPLCLAVKEPAWGVLRPLYPELDDLAVHHRVDGKVCKYLPPPTARDDPAHARAWPVGFLVFPRYVADAATGLKPLSPVSALQRLFDECLAMRHPLDRASVDRLTRWIGGIGAFALTFSSLDAATAAIRTMSEAPTEAPDAAGRPLSVR